MIICGNLDGGCGFQFENIDEISDIRGNSKKIFKGRRVAILHQKAGETNDAMESEDEQPEEPL